MHNYLKARLSAVKDGKNGFDAKKPELDSTFKTPSNKKCIILLVDDEPALLKVYERTLKPFGHNFKAANNGAEGLALFGQGGIDLVISDSDMPKMDGLELLMKAKEIDPGVKFIIITGRYIPEMVAKFLEAGALEVISKPFDAKAFIASVGSALGIGVPDTGPVADKAPESEKEGCASKKHRTILIVEDDNDLREALSSFLETFGYSVRGAPNGKEGLEIVLAGGIDLVISDYNMPMMDGLEMLRAIKKEMPELKVVMHTARADDHGTVTTMLEAGAEAVLLKPVDGAYLEAVLSKLI